MTARRVVPLLVLLLVVVQTAGAAHTPAPASVTIAGSLQSELGCSGDWQPECAATHLAYDAEDTVWHGAFAVPAGTWEYKAPLNDGWDENYGANGERNGANLGLTLSEAATVKFYYDHESHWVTSSRNAVIATVPGSFQSELGCAGDWDPTCLRSWLQDVDGDRVYSFTTAAIPAGSYEAKVAIGESWDENYGAGGERNGANVAFTVAASAETTFRYDATSHILTVSSVSSAPSQDGDVWFDGLAHDSRDTLYRVPGGAVPRGTDVLVRFRTYHDDVTGVTLRTWQDGERLLPMQRVAADVPCGLEFGCDYWQATVDGSRTGTLFYRFIVRDGARTVYYEDDSDVRDGGWGRATDSSPDWGWVVTIHDPAFDEPVDWMKDGVVYQIFPDRFRNGTPANDPGRGNPNAPRWSNDARYAFPNGTPDERARDRILQLPWGTLPEGHCRNYSGVDCEKRWQAGEGREGPFGRDYFGGDLDGVRERLPYLRSLGVTVLFFNPIFAASSNHRYDTRDFRRIDPYLGTQNDWDKLVEDADELGIKVILDGVFNHTSSDSPLFDRYRNFAATGACESTEAATRSWYHFRPPRAAEPAACAPFTRSGDSFYTSWAGFDSLPQLSENAAVREYVHGADDAVARHWLREGAEGWRLDVMQEKSHDFWREFRGRVYEVEPETVIIGELWKKFDVLPYIHGDTADTAMNYRLRDATIGLLAPQAFDAKGFPGSGSPISASAFRNRLESVREDYPDRTYFSLMNLLDSHDTERLLWTLTPGAESPAAREHDAANLAEGKRRQRLAALVQLTQPGAPTIYYGDEVGLTGDDDPDDRRTYPWSSPDNELLAHYRGLTQLRAEHPSLRGGGLRFLLADDSAGTVAYGRKLGNDAVVVALNSSEQERTLRIPVAGYLPDGARLGDAAVAGGELAVALGPLEGRALVVDPGTDLTPPAPPEGLAANAAGLTVQLSWAATEGASSYAVYRSPVTRGGYERIGTTTGTTYEDADAALRSGQPYHYVVRALDAAGNEGAGSNEARVVPSHAIGWANLQWPPTLDYTVSASQTTDTVYGQLWIENVTSRPGPTPGLRAELGYGAQGSNPAGWTTWVAMTFNVDAGNNDEYQGALQPTVPGTYSYFTRFSTDGGGSWTYGSLTGPGTGAPGTMTVRPPADTTPPAAPAGLVASGAGPTTVTLDWEPVDASDLFRYDVYRGTVAGGPYELVDATSEDTTAYADVGLVTGTRYFYVVRAVDDSANASAPSNESSAVPLNREIEVTFVVTPPSTTPADATLSIAGNQPQLCNFCNPPHPVTLAKGDDGKWRVTLSFTEGTSLEYKYTLGDWFYVEKGAACDELSNRAAQVAGGADGTQTIENAVLNWRNVSPCGD